MITLYVDRFIFVLLNDSWIIIFLMENIIFNEPFEEYYLSMFINGILKIDIML